MCLCFRLYGMIVLYSTIGSIFDVQIKINICYISNHFHIYVWIFTLIFYFHGKLILLVIFFKIVRIVYVSSLSSISKTSSTNTQQRSTCKGIIKQNTNQLTLFLGKVRSEFDYHSLVNTRYL